jgi:hypothetical protein
LSADRVYSAIDETYRALCRIEDELDAGGEVSEAAQSYFLRLWERMRDQTHLKLVREVKRTRSHA